MLPKINPVAALAVIAGSISTGAAENAHWMWADGERIGATEPLEFSRTFTIDELPSGGATLRALGDFCSIQVTLNGKLVAKAEPYDPVLAVPVKPLLQEGDNELLVRVRGVPGPSALALDLAFDAGEAPVLTSGDGWRGASVIAPMAALGLSDPELREIAPLDEYNQWTEAKGNAGEAKFSPLPEGFELERLRVAKPEEDSWVSMAFDSEGRLVIGKEKRGLLRMTLAKDGEPASVETVEDTLLECRGLLFAHGALYANANNTKALYRLRDSTGDGRFDEVTPLMKSDGSVGHGRNDLALGPDGLIYAICGDSVKLPTEIVRQRQPGFTRGKEKGYLARVDAAGKNREIICVGLRNPYGVAFNTDGEPFTYDADNEGDVGLPLYRPTRVNHLVSGANYGWWQVGGNQNWPVYYPDTVPTTIDIGRGSPTSVAFGYGSNFPPRYRDALFVLDWAYGRIVAVDVVARGASYTCRAETFLRGRPLNVTDLEIGPDGAMYFVTGGRKTQSALYRIRYTGEPVTEPEATAQENARAEFSQKARAKRKKLETFHGRVDADALGVLEPLLDDPDPWIRNAARVALEQQPAESWSGRALETGSLNALLALARFGPEDKLGALLQRTRSHAFAELSRSQKLTVLRIQELASARGATLDRAFLSPLFPDDEPSVNRELSKLLLRLGDEPAVGKSLTLLAAAGSQFDRLHYLETLSYAKGGWTPEGRRAYFGVLRHRDYFRGDRNMPKFLKGIRDRATASLSAEERESLKPLLEPEKKADPVKAPTPRPVVKHWAVEELATAPAAEFRPDYKLGRQLFETALCSRCHQIGGLGTAVGPNLTTSANRFSRRDLIEAIVKPSDAIAEIFQQLVIKKKDGSTVVGRVVRDDFRKSTVSLVANPFAPDELTIVSKKEIGSHEVSPASPMPPGLLDSLSREEVDQLLAFIEHGGRR